MRTARAAGDLPLFAGFLLTGVLTVLLGPLISELLARESITQAQAALLFPAQFVASSAGSVLSSRHLRRSLRVGYFAAAGGVAVLALQAWPLPVAGAALLGFGLGLTIPATNLLVAERHRERRAAALATLNLVWSLGAVSCPLLFTAIDRGVPSSWLLGSLAALTAVAGVAILATQGTEPPAPLLRQHEPTAPDVGLAQLLFLGAMLFLYVGSESAIGGWLVTLSDRLGGDRSIASLFIGSGFWAALLVGRAVTPLLLRSWSEEMLFRTALALAAAGALLVLLADSRSTLALGAVAAGLGLAPLFPLTVSRISSETAGRSARLTGWAFVGSGLGGATLPWLTERVGGGALSLQHGFVVPLVGLVLLALLALRRAPSAPS